jgi:hypothetical protein
MAPAPSRFTGLPVRRWVEKLVRMWCSIASCIATCSRAPSPCSCVQRRAHQHARAGIAQKYRVDGARPASPVTLIVPPAACL